MTVKQIMEIDSHDQDLTQYKKRLLGELDENNFKEGEPAFVEIKSVEIVCEERPGGNILIDFTKED